MYTFITMSCNSHPLPTHRPQLGEKGGGRLLQKALLGLGRKRPSDETEEDVHVPKVKGTVFAHHVSSCVYIIIGQHIE